MSPLPVLVIGAGNRGSTYARHPELKAVGVAEPNPRRRRAFQAAHDIRDHNAFADWRDAILGTADIEAVVIATPDQEHVGPAVAASARGLHILLEKPMATTEADCLKIVEACEASGVVASVCHVMRHAPNFQVLKRVVEERRLGQLLSLRQIEPVGHWHFAHSFVRGNWRLESETTFSLLSKCCHDVDLICWLMGATADNPVVRVSSTGKLVYFKKSQKPKEAGDSARCLECPLNRSCPYSASRIYGELAKCQKGKAPSWPLDIVLPGDCTVVDEGVLESCLREGPYGRCVFECDNDVADQQSVLIDFEDGTTAVLSMVATTAKQCQRRVELYGSHGEVIVDGSLCQFTSFDVSNPLILASSGLENLKQEVEERNRKRGQPILTQHDGCDDLLVVNFVDAVRRKDPSHVLTGPRESYITHRVAFAAEKARKERRVVELEALA